MDRDKAPTCLNSRKVNIGVLVNFIILKTFYNSCLFLEAYAMRTRSIFWIFKLFRHILYFYKFSCFSLHSSSVIQGIPKKKRQSSSFSDDKRKFFTEVIMQWMASKLWAIQRKKATSSKFHKVCAEDGMIQWCKALPVMRRIKSSIIQSCRTNQGFSRIEFTTKIITASACFRKKHNIKPVKQ